MPIVEQPIPLAIAYFQVSQVRRTLLGVCQQLLFPPKTCPDKPGKTCMHAYWDVRF